MQQQGKKRGPYKRRFHKPLFPELNAKTTTELGRRTYQMLYMRKVRAEGNKR
jgi:hypothetical protein